MSNAKQLAIDEASYQGCDLTIVLATVDAETSFTNILGDSGNALGYGQVWPKWHREAFEYAGGRLKIPVPSDLTNLQQTVLNNDEFSMIVAVKVIKNVWLESNKDWDTFTKAYVGPQIPKSDYNRRLAIYEKYLNGSPASSTSSTGFGGNMNALGGNELKEFESTSYSVEPNTLRSVSILYGRRYRIIVANDQGTGLDVSDLRCTFKVTKTLQMQPNISEITIYNLNARTENTLIKEGSRIVIEAGYIGEQYGVIFEGSILQPIREKEDGTTYKLTLTSLDGDRFFNDGFVNITLKKDQTARKVIESVVNSAKNPVKFGAISETLTDSSLTRGKVVFGLARDVLRQVAQTQNATFYIENNKVNIIKADDVPAGEIIELSPTSGLIGTPSQNEMGITIKSLLNPRLTVGKLIHVDNSLVRALQRSPTFSAGQTKPSVPVIRNLDDDGVYRIIKITFTGDTRGDDWYCEMECINQSGLLPSIATTSNTKILN